MGLHFPITPATRAAIEAEIELLIGLLDAIDGDVDLEEGGDLEPDADGEDSYDREDDGPIWFAWEDPSLPAAGVLKSREAHLERLRASGWEPIKRFDGELRYRRRRAA